MRDYFSGIRREAFDSCRPKASIKKAINALEQLRVHIEPNIQNQFNRRLHGIVSQAKEQGTHEYRDWAALMFTTAPLAPSSFRSWHGKPVGANLLTQLTVNIDKRNLFAGVCIKKAKDSKRLRAELERDKNSDLLDQIVSSLAGRKWVISQKEQDWERREPKLSTEQELRVALLDPKLQWINARFARSESIVETKEIANQILAVFRILFNIYAMATGLSVVEQPKPSGKPLKASPVLVDRPTNDTKPDQEIIQNILDMMSQMGKQKPPPKAKIPEKEDYYMVQRKCLPLNLTHCITDDSSGKRRTFYLDKGFSKSDVERRITLFDDFRAQLNTISNSVGANEDYIQIALTNPHTDARYLNSGHVIANLINYEKHRSVFFWLFAVARETAYLRKRRLSYAHLCIMRNVLLTGLSRFPTFTEPKRETNSGTKQF